MTNAFFLLLFSSTCNNDGIWALDGAVFVLLTVPVRKESRLKGNSTEIAAINNL